MGEVSVWGAVAVRPDGGATTTAALLVVLAVLLLVVGSLRTRPRRPVPVGDGRPAPLPGDVVEPPAVVGLLTGGFRTPNLAVTATLLDLAAREWVRLAVVDGSVVVLTRDAGRAGDPLTSYEQQVLNHVAARSVGGVATAAALVNARQRLDRRWWRRLRRDVARHATRLGLTTRRFTAAVLGPGVVCAALAGVALVVAARGADDAAALRDSIPALVAWCVTAAAAAVTLGAAARLARSDAQRPTAIGQHRADQWLGYRRRLAARIPDGATPVAPRDAQAALAHAHAMGLAPHLGDDLPLTAEDPRLAWSEAGDAPHVVRVRYPWWPSYGRSALSAILLGATVLGLAVALHVFARRVADGEALVSLIDDLGDWTSRIETLAGVVAAAALVPAAWGVYSLLAGLVDCVAMRRRDGFVVRVRDPLDVARLRRRFSPFGFRDRIEWFMAIDDGRRWTVTAWIADERSAAPQGSRARVTATAALGRVRSSEPVGTAGTPAVALHDEAVDVPAWPDGRTRQPRHRRHRPRSFS
jgi:Predicted membrane protein (DUF2207)